MPRINSIPSGPDTDLQAARQALLDDDRVLKRKVRCVAAEGDTSENALHLYTLAAGHKFEWTEADWRTVLNKLDECELTVGEWINDHANQSA